MLPVQSGRTRKSSGIIDFFPGSKKITQSLCLSLNTILEDLEGGVTVGV